MATNPACLQALRTLIEILQQRQILYVVIGGSALQMLYGITSMRVTADVDTVVLVDTWEEYGALLEALRGQGWGSDPEHEYRLRAPGGCIVDLLPCPLREIQNDRLVLPRSRSVLSTIGWVEALTTAREVMLEPIGALRVPTPQHLAAIKAAAWYERSETKDAYDSVTLCRQFGDADAIIEEVATERAATAIEARAALLARAVQAEVPAAVKALRTLAESLADPRGALPTRLWGEFERERDVEAFRGEMIAIARGLLNGLAGS